jgi:outer membrane protein assembly factor BamB
MNRQGALKVLDGSTGALRWETALVDFDPEGGSLPRLSFRRGLLVVSWVSLSGSHLATFESATGAPGWVYDAPNFSTVPAVTDQSVSFAQTVTIDRHHVVSASVRSLELQTGRVLWSHDLTSRGVFFPDLAGAAGAGRVVVVDHLGAVRAFGEVSGEPLWRRTTRRPQVAVEPVIAGGVVVVPVLDSRLLGWQLDAGSAASMGALGGPQVGLTIEGAAADGSRLYVLVAGPRGDGEVWGYEAASGSGGGPPLH